MSLLKISRVARELDVSDSQVKKYIRDGKIPFVILPDVTKDKYRIREEHFIEFKDSLKDLIYNKQ